MNLFSGLDGLGDGLQCPDQLDEELSWDMNLKLEDQLEDPSRIAALLIATLNQPEEPWPAPE